MIPPFSEEFNLLPNNTKLARTLSKKLGDVQVSFQNVNRSPSYIFEGSSSFNFGNALDTKKENITVLTAEANNPRFSLMARNISIANYTYFKKFLPDRPI